MKEILNQSKVCQALERKTEALQLFKSKIKTKNFLDKFLDQRYLDFSFGGKEKSLKEDEPKI